LEEDVDTAPSEKNDNDLEEDDGSEPSVDKEIYSFLDPTESSNNSTNHISKIIP
jgi:hypothetical protein